MEEEGKILVKEHDKIGYTKRSAFPIILVAYRIKILNGCMLENVSLRTKCGLSTEHQDVSQTKHEAFNANLAFV